MSEARLLASGCLDWVAPSNAERGDRAAAIACDHAPCGRSGRFPHTERAGPWQWRREERLGGLGRAELGSPCCRS